MVSKVPIMLGKRYRLTSFGNGWAYELEDTIAGHSLWFQDEAAGLVREEIEAEEILHPTHDVDAILSVLWDCYAIAMEEAATV